MFCVDEIELEAQTLTVRCSGFFGRGSEGAGDGGKLRSSIDSWLDGNPATQAKQIVIDFRDVDYVWGDWPVSAVLPIVKQRGILEIRYLASPDNRQALEGLIEACNITCFGVQADQA